MDNVKEVQLYDRSHWGLIKVTGGDRLRFLHNQTTNDFEQLKPGEGCETVFVTSTARTIDLVTAYIQEDAVLLLVSPSRKERLLEWMERYLFPMDKVNLEDISPHWGIFTLVGNDSKNLLSQWINEDFLKEKIGSNKTIKIDDISLFLGVGNGLAKPGYNLIFPQDKTLEIQEKLIAKNAILKDKKAYDKLRILQGRPKPDAELTEDYNPLEAGLWQTISFEKGCYIGQETIARLNTYKGVKQRLWGIKVNQPVNPGSTITIKGEKVGLITSYTDTENGGFALGYIRTKAGGLGLKVEIDQVLGEVVKLPFVSHQYYNEK